MNPDEKNSEQSGISAARGPNSLSEQIPEKEDGMKRAAARQMIEKYYYQLTDGCGNENCQNEDCASCSSFAFKDKTKNELAIKAIDLFKGKADLCGSQPSKVPRAENVAGPSKVSSEEKSPTAKVITEEKPSSSKGQTTALFSQQSTCNVIKPIPTSAAETINYLTEEKVLKLIKDCEEENNWSKLIRVIGATFNNADSLIMSFRRKEVMTSSTSTVEEEKVSEQERSQSSTCDRETAHSLDLEAVRRTFRALMKIPDLPYQGALVNALSSLSKNVEMELRYRRPLEQNPNYMNIFLIVMEIPLDEHVDLLENAFPEFCKALGHMDVSGKAKLAKIWSTFGAEWLLQMTRTLHQVITVRIAQNHGRWGRMYQLNDDEGIGGATKVMKILFYASIIGGGLDPDAVLAEEKETNEREESLQDMLQGGAVGHEHKDLIKPKEDPLAQELKVSVLDCRKPLVPYDEFVNELLNEYVDIEVDYKNKLESKFSFMNHNFILSTASKHMCMYYDNRVRMFNERRSSILNTFLRGLPPTPFLRLRVRRDHLIDDALVNLEMTAMDNPQDLKKQLIVEFEGEHAMDEGGVSKEFFQLVVEEIFNPDFGMFTYNEQTRQFWFNPTSFENDGQFTLIGIVLGLAIYNSTIVDIHFPSVVYRKLMGKKGRFEDLKDLDPTLYASLQHMLEYEGEDIEDVFMQPFKVGYKDVFGCDLTHELKERGGEMHVNHENKEEFVELYSDFMLNKSVEKQFRAFKRGFNLVTSESPLRILFRPEEVEVLICGSTHFDFYDLQKSTEYDGGFTADSPTIKHFWEIVHEFSEDQKRRLLQFTTGTDRVPVGGLTKIKLIIARNGPDSDRLPTAHTCFNVLLLPDYCTKEKLKDRLEKAVDYSKGFGML
ncbi:ubiquitin-protein ligase E3A-like [Saccostrea echinata]|uniref:ubiquitin-protein ligase E3A-like n=1 Tax=Saccostrea echinata TaxID=191078 RepID=UPI002A7EDCB5|nr:ubiquitin-protein ligase E3A-like [Saccostrea echinata]